MILQYSEISKSNNTYSILQLQTLQRQYKTGEVALKTVTALIGNRDTPLPPYCCWPLFHCVKSQIISLVELLLMVRLPEHIIIVMEFRKVQSCLNTFNN